MNLKYVYRLLLISLIHISIIYPLSNIIDEGLSFEIFDSNQKSIVGDSKVTIIKIDPELYELNLLSSKQYNHKNLTVKDWSKKQDHF